MHMIVTSAAVMETAMLKEAWWRRSVVVSALAWSTKLIDTAPGYYLDGWLLTGR